MNPFRKRQKETSVDIETTAATEHVVQSECYLDTGDFESAGLFRSTIMSAIDSLGTVIDDDQITESTSNGAYMRIKKGTAQLEDATVDFTAILDTSFNDPSKCASIQLKNSTLTLYSASDFSVETTWVSFSEDIGGATVKWRVELSQFRDVLKLLVEDCEQSGRDELTIRGKLDTATLKIDSVLRDVGIKSLTSI